MAAAFPAPLKLSVLNLNRPTRSCDTIHPIPHLDSRDTAVDADLHFSRAALSSFRCRACSICILWCTGRMGWMAYRKWKECKQQPGTAGPGNMLGCCLIYFHFLWAIHPIRPVEEDVTCHMSLSPRPRSSFFLDSFSKEKCHRENGETKTKTSFALARHFRLTG